MGDIRQCHTPEARAKEKAQRHRWKQTWKQHGINRQKFQECEKCGLKVSGWRDITHGCHYKKRSAQIYMRVVLLPN